MPLAGVCPPVCMFLYREKNTLKMTIDSYVFSSPLCFDRDTPVFCALINGEGEVVDFLRLPHFMKRRNAFREDEREKKVKAENTSSLCLTNGTFGLFGHFFDQCVVLRQTTLRT